MGRHRAFDRDAILDRWAAGEAPTAIAHALQIACRETVRNIVKLARSQGDGRAARRDPWHLAPLHKQLGIKTETRFVPTLVDGAEHWRRTPVTVASLCGGPLTYDRSTYRQRKLPGLVQRHVRQAQIMHSQAAE